MRRRGWVVVLVALAIVVGACGLDKPKPTPPPQDDGPRVSADDLGDAFQDGSTDEFLSPTERAALERVGGAPAEPQSVDPPRVDEPPKGFFGQLADTLGKIGVALLGVGVTLGIAAAPFLIF